MSIFSWVSRTPAPPRRIQRKQTPLQKKQYHELRQQAKVLVSNRLAYFNQHYGFSYNRISIRNQKTRWGSCSSKGNLNFSYRILLLPPDVQDYLIVHELCHLKEFNHSKKFWAIVSEQVPNHPELHKKLHQFSLQKS